MCLTLALTLVPAGQIRAGGSKKPSLKKKISVTVGKKATVKLKNSKKNAKISWKTSNKSVVKILKKKTVKKGKKARAVVKGVSVGKAKITAVYKLGKKKTKLKCTVTVTDDGTPNGTPTSPVVAPTNNPDTTPAATDKAQDATDAPKTDAPKTEAPPTIKPTDAPDRPTVTNDPYASELVVPMTKANQAFAAEEAVYNEDGTVSVALSPADSGHGICFYFNTEKLSVDLTDYKELVISYDSTDAYEMAISLKEYIPDTAAESYWDGADSSKCPIVGSEQYTTFSKGSGEYRLDISSIKETAGGVFIKYNTYNAGDAASLPNAEMTIKSIKLIKDPATVSTQPPATEEPGPDTSPEPDTSAEPGTTKEPSVTEDPYADLKVNISKANEAFLDTNGTAEYNEDGTVKVSLNKDNSGMGICFYLNDAHASVDLSQYKSLEITYETEKAYDMAVSMKGEIPAGAATDYWAGADSSKCPIVGGEKYTTFSKGAGEYSLDISSIKDAAQGVFIKYNTYNKEDESDQLAEITIKSITLVRDVTVAPPTTEPTKDPEATEAPTEAPTVTKVEVDNNGAVVYVGKTLQFTATVSGTGNYSKDVTWSVEPAVDGVSISTSGNLTVGKDVPDGTPVTVKAVSKADPNVYGTSTVKVTWPKVSNINLYTSDRVTEIEPDSTLVIKANVSTKGGTITDYTLKWEIEPAVDGVSITDNNAGNRNYLQNATLNVGKDVADGTKITVKATSNLTPSVTATYELTVKASDYVLNLAEENKVYSNADSLIFENGGVKINTTTTSRHIGFYLNAQKTDFDYKQYKAIKVNATVDEGAQVKLRFTFVSGSPAVGGNAAKYGGGQALCNKAVTTDSEEFFVRTDYMTPNNDLTTNPVVLDIQPTIAGNVTINSITFLKEYPHESEDLSIDISESNIAFSDAKAKNFHDGQCEVTLEYGQKIGFYIKADKSEVSPLDYALFAYDLVQKDVSVSSIQSGFSNDVSGQETVGQKNSVSVQNPNRSYWKTSTISSSYKIPEAAKANVVYITNNKSSEQTFVIKGLRLTKYQY